MLAARNVRISDRRRLAAHGSGGPAGAGDDVRRRRDVPRAIRLPAPVVALLEAAGFEDVAILDRMASSLVRLTARRYARDM
jgi:hypothetical protein